MTLKPSAIQLRSGACMNVVYGSRISGSNKLATMRGVTLAENRGPRTLPPGREELPHRMNWSGIHPPLAGTPSLQTTALATGTSALPNLGQRERLKMMQGDSVNAVQGSAILSIVDTLDTLSVSIEDNKGALHNKGALQRISGKLGGGAVGASLLFWVGGVLGTRIDEHYGQCRGWFPINEQYASQSDSCSDIASLLGATTGWVLGASIGVSMLEPNDRFSHSLVGSLGGLVTCGLLTLISSGTLWPSMVAGPIIGSIVASEWSRHAGLSGKSDIAPGKGRRFSIGLGSASNGDLAGVLRLRF